ncbi:MAG TPA: hypothetical protein IAC74_02740, partial [Candidatus Aphodoplasma excrementigallinarum]|nr:hypothetical protein [Candidatus Aphodoplasma excrementigallinarum]
MKRYLSVFLALALVLGTVLVPGGASAAVVYDKVYYDKDFDAYDNDLKLGASEHPSPQYDGDKVVVIKSDGTADSAVPGLYPGRQEYQNIVVEGRYRMSSTTAKREAVGIGFVSQWSNNKRDLVLFDEDGNVKLVPNQKDLSTAITAFEGYKADTWYTLTLTVGATPVGTEPQANNVRFEVLEEGAAEPVVTTATIDCGDKINSFWFTQYMVEGEEHSMMLDWFKAGNVENMAGVSAPEVAITSPANGASLPMDEPVVLTASAQATEDGAAITKVEFYEDGNKLGEAAAEPYTYTWSGASAGEHTVKAIATDSNGARSESESVTFTLVDGSFQTEKEFYRDEFSKDYGVWKTEYFGKTVADGGAMTNLESGDVKYLEISSDGAGTSQLSTYNVNVPGGKYTFYGRFAVDNSELQREVFQLLFARQEGGSYRVSNFVMFDTDGNIKGRTAGGAYITLVEGFAANKWYEISATFENSKYQEGDMNVTYTVTPEGEAPVTKETYLDLARDATFRALFVSQAGEAGKSGKFLLDYVGMYENLEPVGITSPTAGATYFAGDTVDVGITVNGIASSVDVYVDGVYQGTATGADGLYSYQLSGLGAGKHAITVKAESLAGEQAESAPVEIVMEDGLVISSMFQNDMVLQRRQNVNVWGSGPNGETITVTVGKTSAQATVENNEWNVVLPPMEAGGPYEMTITGRDSGFTKTFANVMVGEVWVTSGQSNMAFTMRWFGQQDNAKTMENVRLFSMDIPDLNDPAEEITNGKWNVCTPESAYNYSAVSYYLAEELYEATGVPVGIICAGVGGSPALCWMSKDVCEQSDYLKSYYQSGPVGVASRASAYYNSSIAPLHNFTVAGAIWYQGAADSYSTVQYDQVVMGLINDWRSKWQQETLPFIIVQEQSYAEPEATRMWARVREGQQKAADTLDDVYLVPLLDGGEPTNIHPGDKRRVGERLSAVIQALDFEGSNTDVFAPSFESARVDGNKIVVTLKDCTGLISSDGEALREFEICGADGVFAEAKAEITGTNEITISSDLVSEPAYVRYAFRNCPDVNLFGTNGLPVTPFRTDDYYGYYLPRAYHKTQYAPGEPVVAEVDVSKISGGVEEVALYLDGVKKATLTEEPYTYDFGSFEGGRHSINVMAVGTDGVTYPSFRTNFYVGTPEAAEPYYTNDYDNFAITKDMKDDFSGYATTNIVYQVTDRPDGEAGDKCLVTSVTNGANTSLYNYLSETVEILQIQFDFQITGDGSLSMLLPNARERIGSSDLFTIKDGVMTIPGVADPINVTKDTWHTMDITLYGQTGRMYVTLDGGTPVAGRSSSIGAVDRLKSTITDTSGNGTGIYIDNFSLTSLPYSEAAEEPAPDNTITLTASATGAGVVAISGGSTGASVTGEVELGAPVTLTATADANETFLFWVDAAGRILSREASYTLTPVSG